MDSVLIDFCLIFSVVFSTVSGPREPRREVEAGQSNTTIVRSFFSYIFHSTKSAIFLDRKISVIVFLGQENIITL